MTTAYLGMSVNVVVDAFVIVVIGGLGSIIGSAVGSLLVGFAETWGSYYVSEMAMILMYGVMGAVLIFRPHGLFGEDE
jgi:branched-subunit amino acid ABC-type transport system permease component